jgi:hypothetical protein
MKCICHEQKAKCDCLKPDDFRMSEDSARWWWLLFALFVIFAAVVILFNAPGLRAEERKAPLGWTLTTVSDRLSDDGPPYRTLSAVSIRPGYKTKGECDAEGLTFKKNNAGNAYWICSPT